MLEKAKSNHDWSVKQLLLKKYLDAIKKLDATVNTDETQKKNIQFVKKAINFLIRRNAKRNRHKI